MSILEYLNRKDKLTNTRFIINEKGNGFYVEDEKQYTREAFNKKYPLPISLIINNKANYDKSRDFLIVD